MYFQHQLLLTSLRFTTTPLYLVVGNMEEEEDDIYGNPHVKSEEDPASGVVADANGDSDMKHEDVVHADDHEEDDEDEDDEDDSVQVLDVGLVED